MSSQLNRKGPIDAEIEIYKSNDTIADAIKIFEATDFYKQADYSLSLGEAKGNLQIDSSESLLSISFTSKNKEVSRLFLDLLNKEFINDRKDFQKNLA